MRLQVGLEANMCKGNTFSCQVQGKDPSITDGYREANKHVFSPVV